MHYMKLGDYLAVSRITGPRHNLLQIRLARFEGEPLDVECLPPRGGCVHEPLDEKLLVARVREGVLEANKELGQSYSISGIKYVQNDTKPEVVYGALAVYILRHLHANGEFSEPSKLMERVVEEADLDFGRADAG